MVACVKVLAQVGHLIVGNIILNIYSKYFGH